MTLDTRALTVMRHLGIGLADVLADGVDKHLVDSHWGGTHAGLEDGVGFQCTRRGIEVETWYLEDVPGADEIGLPARCERTVLFTITWRQLRDYAEAIPFDLRAELRDARDEGRRLRGDWCEQWEREFWRTDRPRPTAEQRDAHDAAMRDNTTRLRAACDAALAFDPAEHEAEQLDLFAAVG